MSVSICNYVSSINNAVAIGKVSCLVNLTKGNVRICEILKDKGFISKFSTLEDSRKIEVFLKYFHDTPSIREMFVVSKPGRRIYEKAKDLKPFKNGLGFTIISTNAGVITSEEAVIKNVGGEILMRVF